MNQRNRKEDKYSEYSWRDLSEKSRGTLVTILDAMISKLDLEVIGFGSQNEKHLKVVFLPFRLEEDLRRLNLDKMDIPPCLNILEKEVTKDLGFEFKFLDIYRMEDSADWIVLYEKLKEFRSILEPKKSTLTEIFISKEGTIYREPKKDLKYNPEKDSKYTKILLYLSDHNSYIKTADINRAVRYKNEVTLRRVIGSLNDKLKSGLQLNQKVIEGEKGRGYRINPLFKITHTRS